MILACIGTIGFGSGVQCWGKPEVCLDDSIFPDRGFDVGAIPRKVYMLHVRLYYLSL